jgi:hypothetical protein
MNETLQNLRVLSIFHYVVGGLAALFACIPLIHFVIGLMMVTGGFPDADPDAPLHLIGAVMMVIAGIIILMGWTFAVLVILAGRGLAARRNYMFCLVMAGVECIFMPFGTVLGVFTIILLTRSEVRLVFEGQQPDDDVSVPVASSR